MKRREFLKSCLAVATALCVPVDMVIAANPEMDEAALMAYFQKKIQEMMDNWDKRMDEMLLKDSDGYVAPAPKGIEDIGQELRDSGYNVIPNKRHQELEEKGFDLNDLRERGYKP